MTLRALHDDFINRLIRYPSAASMRLRILRFRLLGARIGRHCWIRSIQIPRNPWDIVIEEHVALDDKVVLLSTGARKLKPRLHIGRGTYVNRFTMFDASDSIHIGARCMIGPFCYVTDHDHGFGEEGPISDQSLVEAPVKVGNNVWIGAHAIILKGVTIGDNAVVGAGAVVTRSVGPAERVAGVPAVALNARRRVDEGIQSEASNTCVSRGSAIVG